MIIMIINDKYSARAIWWEYFFLQFLWMNNRMISHYWIAVHCEIVLLDDWIETVICHPLIRTCVFVDETCLHTGIFIYLIVRYAMDSEKKKRTSACSIRICEGSCHLMYVPVPVWIQATWYACIWLPQQPNAPNKRLKTTKCLRQEQGKEILLYVSLSLSHMNKYVYYYYSYIIYTWTMEEYMNKFYILMLNFYSMYTVYYYSHENEKWFWRYERYFFVYFRAIFRVELCSGLLDPSSSTKYQQFSRKTYSVGPIDRRALRPCLEPFADLFIWYKPHSPEW